MTIKELKEKIKENPNKVMNVEWTKTVPIEYLELLNENLDVGEILKDKYSFTYQAKKCLEELCAQYDDNFEEEVRRFIDFASKQLPNFVFDYTIVDEKKGNVTVWFTYIYNNELIRKSIFYHNSDNKINHNWLLERIIDAVEKEHKHF